MFVLDAINHFMRNIVRIWICHNANSMEIKKQLIQVEEITNRGLREKLIKRLPTRNANSHLLMQVF